MSQNKDASKKSTETIALPSENTKIDPHAKNRENLLSLPQIVIALIALIALVLASSAYYQSKQLRHYSDLHKSELSARLAELEIRQNSIQSNLASTTQSLQNSRDELKRKMEELNQNLQTALQQRLFQKQDWLLLRAKYYLELAQVNAHWSADQEATIALLQAADFVLQDVSDQQIFSIRQSIAEEISTIKAIPKIDTAGLLSQLDAAERMTVELPVKQPLSSLNQAHPNTVSTPQNSWERHWQNSLSLLGKLIVIRKHDENIEPMFSPLHQTLMRESIRMNLQEAQWAILQNNEQIYKQALAGAIKDIKLTFEETASPTQALLTQIQNLESVSLNTKAPVINHSLNLLNQYIETRQSSLSNKQTGGQND